MHQVHRFSGGKSVKGMGVNVAAGHRYALFSAIPAKQCLYYRISCVGLVCASQGDGRSGGYGRAKFGV